MSSKFARRKQPDYILSEESALDQIHDFLDYYDIDIDTPKVPKEGLEMALEKVTDYVRRGTVEIARDKEHTPIVTVHLTKGETLVFPEIGARHKLVMEKSNGEGGLSRILALMGCLCGMGSIGLEKLPARDLSVIEALGLVFLAA